MIPFHLFALGLCAGLTAQAAGMVLRCRSRSPVLRIWSLRLWATGVLLLLLTAVYDHDALLFCGQLLAALLLRRWLFTRS